MGGSAGLSMQSFLTWPPGPSLSVNYGTNKSTSDSTGFARPSHLRSDFLTLSLSVRITTGTSVALGRTAGTNIRRVTDAEVEQELKSQLLTLLKNARSRPLVIVEYRSTLHLFASSASKRGCWQESEGAAAAGDACA